MPLPYRHPRGLIAAVLTPLSDDGSTLDLDAIPKLADYLHSTGVKGLFVCGTTGEFGSLTVDERKAVLERWVQINNGRFQIIAHVGHMCIPTSVELAQHAESLKVDSIAVVPFWFLKPANVDALIQCLQVISSGAPRTPMYYYHNPSLCGINYRVLDIFKAADRLGLNTLVGAKYTDIDMWDFQQCIEYANGRYQMIYGREEQFLVAMAAGAECAIGSTYNFNGKITNDLLDAIQANDMQKARQLQSRIHLLLNHMAKTGNILVAHKSIMKMVGASLGGPRLPLSPISEEATAELEKNLRADGLI